MTDLSQTIAPKSDQLNADDLISGPRTVTITRVTGDESSAEQPISIFFNGDQGRPFKPCKSMRRVLVQIWGPDGNAYVGKSMTLYRDPKVKFGGIEVGGIRISHMSDMQQAVTLSLTASKAKRAPYRVEPLSTASQSDVVKYQEEGRTVARRGAEAFRAWWLNQDDPHRADKQAACKPILAELQALAKAAEEQPSHPQPEPEPASDYDPFEDGANA